MNNMIPGNIVNVVIYRNGRPTEVFYRRNDHMPFVQAEVGDNFKIRVSTNGWQGRRLEAYLSVDGRSAHRNTPASFVADRGLVFSGETMFEGYRLNENEVSPFVVTYPERSVLAVTTGDITNAGVIGLGIFREYEPPVQPMGGDYGVAKGGLESLTMRGSSPVGMTGEGRKTSRVGTTTFTRQNSFHPDEIIVVQYRPMWWLRQEGIVGRSNDPNPFPGNDTGYGFLG